jgi:uncharacterized protein YkwD
MLLVGIAIGRMTIKASGTDDVYLRNSEPTATASPTTTRASAKAAAQRVRRERTPLTHVAPTERAVADPRPLTVRPSKKPGNMIDGSDGDGTTWNTHGGSGGDDGRILAAMEKEVVRLTNIERRRAGCAPLRIDARLIRSARAHSAEMATSAVFDHSSPDGRSPWKRMEAEGYRDGGAENIARGYLTAEEAVRGWMRSQGHSRNILDCRMVATGVGVSFGPGGPWWTQDFGYS